MKSLSLVSCLLSALALAAVLLQDKPEPVLIEAAEPIADRVMDLPEDGGRWSTIVVYPDGAKDIESRAVASWFATEPRLQSLRAQTRFFEFPQTAWWPRSYLPNTPAPYVIVLDENNRTIYHAYRGALPADGESVADEIQTRIADCCPDVPDQKPQHEWQARRKVPLLRPSSPASDDLLSGLAAIAAIGGAAWFGWRSREAA